MSSPMVEQFEQELFGFHLRLGITFGFFGLEVAPNGSMEDGNFFSGFPGGVIMRVGYRQIELGVVSSQHALLLGLFQSVEVELSESGFSGLF